MVSKIIRKLGLGPAALKLIKPFIAAGAALPDVEQALALLQAHNPDKGSSCIITRGRRTGSAFMLDILIPAYNAEKQCDLFGGQLVQINILDCFSCLRNRKV